MPFWAESDPSRPSSVGVVPVDFTVWRGRHLSGCAAVPRLRAGAGRSTGASP